MLIDPANEKMGFDAAKLDYFDGKGRTGGELFADFTSGPRDSSVKA
jgi:hypothetical protein